jgi:hypothetical protein
VAGLRARAVSSAEATHALIIKAFGDAIEWLSESSVVAIQANDRDVR